MKKIAIGIDPGKKTGFALKDIGSGEFLTVESLMIHEAMIRVMELHQKEGVELYAAVEDARKRKWYNDKGMDKKSARGLAMGAASVKRDSVIWEDFLKDFGIPLRLEKPAAGRSKVNAVYFERLTGWKKSTNEHGRDAGMLIHSVNPRNLKLLFR